MANLKEAFGTNRPLGITDREDSRFSAREKLGYAHHGILRNIDLDDFDENNTTFVFDDEGEVIYIIDGKYTNDQIYQYIVNSVGKYVADAYYDSPATLEVISKQDVVDNQDQWANIETESFPIQLLSKIVRRWAVRNNLGNNLPSIRRK